VALKANNCADFTPKPSGKIEKFVTILSTFAAPFPDSHAVHQIAKMITL
jgi:hypothetical protein